MRNPKLCLRQSTTLLTLEFSKNFVHRRTVRNNSNPVKFSVEFWKLNIVYHFIIYIMGSETNKLLDKRWDYRMYGWLLTLVAVAGMLFALYLVIQPLLNAVRQQSFDPRQANDFYLFSVVPLIQNGAPAPMLFVWCMAFSLVGIAGTVFLTKARRITREIEDTEAEIGRRLRVEESLRERGRAQAR